MLVEDGGRLAVTGENGGVVGQAIQSSVYAVAERFVVASGEVGAPDAAAEERVAGEHPALDFGIEADAASGVARCADDFKCALPYPDGFVVAQLTVGLFDADIALRTEAEPHGLSLGLGEILVGVGMGRDGDAIFILNGLVSNNMVYMSVCIDGHQRLEAVAVDEAEQLVFLACVGAARVDDDTFLAVVVVDDVCVFREGIED